MTTRMPDPLRRVLGTTGAVVSLSLLLHAAAATALTLSGFGIIAVAGLGAGLVGEANRRWHPVWGEPRLTERSPRRMLTDVDDVLDDSFPASDPPAWTTLRSGPPVTVVHA